MPRAVRFAALSSLTLVAASCLALGQDVTTATATLQPSGEVRYQASYRFHLAPLAGATVLDAPYSADEVESIGNGGPDAPQHLLRRIFRDTQGRTREEKTIPVSQQTTARIRLIEISDVPSGWVYLLDPEAKVAHRYRPLFPGSTVASPRTDQTVEVATATTGKPVRRSTAEAPLSDSGFLPHQTVTLRAAIATLPPQDLGERLQEGLHLHGIRYRTPTVSADGTAHDMASEVWVSPVLQVIVETRLPTGQAHDRIIRLTHLVRTEPDPALFLIPPGYRIQDETSDFQIAVDSQAAAR